MNSPLLRVLNAEFKFEGFDGERLKTFFIENYGVDAKNVDDLWLFKYDQILVKWHTIIPFYCRGHICRLTSTGWVLVCNPPDKFFNLGERYCNYQYNPGDFLKEKLDGTAITVWYDTVLKKFRISTLGAINPLNVNDFSITFTELFNNTVSKYVKLDWFYHTLWEDCTYLIELCTTKNMVVTKYPNDIVSILTIRDNTYGTYIRNDTLVELNTQYSFRVPKIHSLYPIMESKSIKDDIEYIQYNTNQAIIDFVEKQSTENYDCVNPEGFVVYNHFNHEPVAKAKNSNYLLLHNIMTGDKKFVLKNLIYKFFDGTIDDIMSDLSDDLIKYIEVLRTEVVRLYGEHEVLKNLMKDVDDRRTYFMTLAKMSEEYPFLKNFQGSMVNNFNNRNHSFTDYLNTIRNTKIPTWKSYMEYWKGLYV